MRLRILFFCGLLISILIRAFFILNGSDIADVHSLWEMAYLTINHINPYLALNYNTYPPLALYLQSATLLLSQHFNIPFYVLIKLWPSLFDLLTTFLIISFLVKKGVKQKIALVWGLIYFLNPISILVSSAHGQLDSIPNFLVLLSIYLLILKPFKFPVILSALSLGAAIAIKPNPLMLLPAFLILTKLSLKEKVLFGALAVLPVLILLKPFIDDYPKEVIKRILEYSGSSDLGSAGLIRGFWYLKGSSYSANFNPTLLTSFKLIFLVLLSVPLFIFNRSKDILRGVFLTYLLFLLIYPGISVQYLIWVLPLACLQLDKKVIPYSVLAVIAMLGFYLLVNPTMITTKLSYIPPGQPRFLIIYLVNNLVLWCVILNWVVKVFKSRSKAGLPLQA